jgi:glutaredoxin
MPFQRCGPLKHVRVHLKRPDRAWARPAAIVLCLAASTGAWAQFKIVESDGRVTYTDRPPVETAAKVLQLGRSGAVVSTPEVALPTELRQAVQRYPVTLYTTTECPSCDAGRKLLQTRGVPFTERRVASEDDAQALDKAVGGRTVPALTIGAQPVRGFSDTDWTAYLDVAGYPRESKLPRNYPTAAVVPVAERAAPAKPAASAPPPPDRRVEPVVPGGLRF